MYADPPEVLQSNRIQSNPMNVVKIKETIEILLRLKEITVVPLHASVGYRSCKLLMSVDIRTKTNSYFRIC
jgi:hypothetical protein